MEIGKEFNTDQLIIFLLSEQMLKLTIQRPLAWIKTSQVDNLKRIKTLALFLLLCNLLRVRKMVRGLFESDVWKIVAWKLKNYWTLADGEQEYKTALKQRPRNWYFCLSRRLFSGDSDSDSIANEVADILHNKKGLICLFVMKMAHAIQKIPVLQVDT